MSEMVERVARAVCTARRWSPENWYLAKDEARAAIEAMREPTPKMIAVGLLDTHPRLSWPAMIDEALK